MPCGNLKQPETHLALHVRALGRCLVAVTVKSLPLQSAEHKQVLMPFRYISVLPDSLSGLPCGVKNARNVRHSGDALCIASTYPEIAVLVP